MSKMEKFALFIPFLLYLSLLIVRYTFKSIYNDIFLDWVYIVVISGVAVLSIVTAFLTFKRHKSRFLLTRMTGVFTATGLILYLVYGVMSV